MNEDSSTTIVGQQKQHRYYCCIDCLTPTSTLYERYATHASIKLTQCAVCGNDVDPFVEREAMLVSFDLILHRIAAYRHVLFNRDQFGEFDVAASVRRSFQFSLGTSILDAYIKFEALRFRLYASSSDMASGSDEEELFLFANLLAMSFLEQMLLVLGTIAAVRPLLDDSTRSYFVSKLCLALVLPSTFKSITIFVHIWENSNTIRMLGSAFVASMQWLSVHAVMEKLTRENFVPKVGKKKYLHRLYLSIPGMPMVAGVVLRLAVPLLLGILLGRDDNRSQCSGVHAAVGERQVCIL